MRFFIAAFFLIFGIQCHAMEPEIVDGVFHLSGDIHPGDYDKLIAFFKKNPHAFVHMQSVFLDSAGGNVSESIKLAQFIRDTSRITVINSNARCVSACFFLFVAGGARVNGGKLGIHRPYYDPAEFKSLTSTKAREAYDQLDNKVRQFLSAMRVPEDIVRQMFTTPSSSIRLLTADEFNQQVGMKQPWFDELAKSACPVQESTCMAYKGRLDRIGMIKTYLGQRIADKEVGWAADYQNSVNTSLAALGTSPGGANSNPTKTKNTYPKLNALHPGWEQLVRTQEFSNWLKSQPPNIQQLEFSSDQDGAIRMIELFKGRQTESERVVNLTCNMQWSTGSRVPVSMDFVVDYQANTVNGISAEISTESIKFSKDAGPGGWSTFQISRRSGAVSFMSGKVGAANGLCIKSQGTKF